MLQFTYDGTMAGLLTAVFEVYERKAIDAIIVKESNVTPDAFAQNISISTNALKARRVWNGLAKNLSREALDQLYYCYLSELPDTERYMLSYIRYALSHARQKIEQDFGHPSVLWVTQTARRVWREKHRMEAFARFEELGDGLFYASIEPDFHVLPLIARHFKSRYADQTWLIYDLRRKQGLHYDKASEELTEVQLELLEGANNKPGAGVPAPREALYQALWKDYFKSTGITARKNPHLHLRHVPLRYWKHLTEKKL